jgi:hypothetical protein
MNEKIDMVNHPPHYNREGAMETIEEMILIFGKEAVISYCLCNAWKYRARALYKNFEEDMKKSDWYLKKYRELKYGTEAESTEHTGTESAESADDPEQVTLFGYPEDSVR